MALEKARKEAARSICKFESGREIWLEAGFVLTLKRKDLTLRK